MDRIAKFAAVTGLMVLVWVDAVPRVSGQAAPADAPHIGGGGVPQFAEERLAQGAREVAARKYVRRLRRCAGACVDSSPAPHTSRNLRAMAAAPVLEFDGAGNFVQGWGGEGQDYQWPQNEHGLHVDPKGFVWIVGNAIPQDGQILKFTKAGKFVMQIGRSGETGGNDTRFLKGASGLRVHPATNELFVSDGYGNSRVMVYDHRVGRVQTDVGRLRPEADRPAYRRDRPAPIADIADSIRHCRTAPAFQNGS